MLRIAACDDEDFILGQLRRLITELGKKHGIKISVELFPDGAGLLKQIIAGERYDIVFMDIEIKQINGIDVALAIREIDSLLQIVYITSHDWYMREAFKVSPVGFISKPITPKLFEEVFLQALKYINHQKQYFYFAYKKENYIIQVKDILYFESNLRKVNIICCEKKFEQYNKLSCIEDELKKYNVEFLRIHQSYLVNIIHIARFTHNCIFLSTGGQLPVSKSYRNKIIHYLSSL
ncbi:MAG: LytR/AlgR family response regulator transcription factor [Lachnospiraceae bacterium]